MSRQIVFFADEPDHRAFLKYAADLGFLALPELAPFDEPPEAVSPLEYKFTDGSHYFYLLPPGLSAAEAFYHEMLGRRDFEKLSPDVSPVIEYMPTRMDAGLPYGRIYFCTHVSDPRYDRALQGYLKLARYLKKWPRTTDARFYVGPRAAASHKAGERVLRYGGKPLLFA